MPTNLTDDEVVLFNQLSTMSQYRIRAILYGAVMQHGAPANARWQEASSFVRTRLLSAPASTLTVAEVYDAYAAWSSAPMSKGQLSQAMLALGLHQHRTPTARRWVGVTWVP